MTSLFTFLLITYQLTHRRFSRKYQLGSKIKKSWLFYVVCASFTVCATVTKKIAAIKNRKITGWQNVKISSYVLLKF